MTVTLVMTEIIGQRLTALAELDVETGGVLLARQALGPDGHLRLLARELIEVPDEAYERREEQQLLIPSEGYVPALTRAEAEGCVPIWVHTHPGKGSKPLFSKHDGVVNEQLADLFRLRAGSEYYGALVVSLTADGGQLAFCGLLESEATAQSIDRLHVVGRRITLVSNYENKHAELPGLYDRNIRALGGEVQRVLRELQVAVIGCGGTGSAVAEQLTRLGVRNLVLVDADVLSASNVTRVYGSTPADIGRSKVDVLGDHLERIAPDLSITRLQSMITSEGTARQLSSADIIFGCTDDNAGRMVLSRIATYMLKPVIDCGVLLSADAEFKLSGIDGRVTVLTPGSACLICRGRIDLALAASEMLTPEERTRRVEEGYAPALGAIEPAVVTFTSMVAAVAVSELLERLIGYGPEPAPSEVLLRLHDRELSTNHQEPRPRHYCHPSSAKQGLGDVTPYLEQTW